MNKFNKFCLGVQLKVFIIGNLASFVTFMIFDSKIEKVNERYDSFDAAQFFFLLSVVIVVFSCIVSNLIFLNHYKWIRKRAIFQLITFYLPVLPLLVLILPYNARNISVLLFLMIPLSVALLQTYHFICFRKGLKSGKY